MIFQPSVSFMQCQYILAQDEGIRGQLQRVREAIRKELPDAAERISWSMPTWWNGHNVIHFAANQKHIGLYPGPEVVVDDLHGFRVTAVFADLLIARRAVRPVRIADFRFPDAVKLIEIALDAPETASCKIDRFHDFPFFRIIVSF